MHSTHRAPLTAGALALAAILAACSTATTASTQPTTQASARTAATSPGTPTTAPKTGTPAAPGALVITGRGWSASGIEGPIPAPGTCHYRRIAGSRDLLPDPRCTPGAVDRAVTQANLEQTVCKPGGYTDSVRPPEDLTDPLKLRIMAAYGVGNDDPSNYELDHVVPLEAGGSSDTRNLYPEPADDDHAVPRSQYVRNDKDEVEAQVRDQLCYDHGNLRSLQRQIASNWVALAHRLG